MRRWKVISSAHRLYFRSAYKEPDMHDLQTIIKLNAPLNLRTDAATQRAYEIALSAKSEPVPALDRVEYGNDRSAA